MDENALDKFGELLVREVRDRTISEWDRIFTGEMKGRTAETVRHELAGVSTEAVEILKSLIPRIVDTTLHHAMTAIEQNESLEVAVETETGRCGSLREVSDGLSGELYGINGWISRFSRERHEES